MDILKEILGQLNLMLRSNLEDHEGILAALERNVATRVFLQMQLAKAEAMSSLTPGIGRGHAELSEQAIHGAGQDGAKPDDPAPEVGRQQIPVEGADEGYVGLTPMDAIIKALTKAGPEGLLGREVDEAVYKAGKRQDAANKAKSKLRKAGEIQRIEGRWYAKGFIPAPSESISE